MVQTGRKRTWWLVGDVQERENLKLPWRCMAEPQNRLEGGGEKVTAESGWLELPAWGKDGWLCFSYQDNRAKRQPERLRSPLWNALPALYDLWTGLLPLRSITCPLLLKTCSTLKWLSPNCSRMLLHIAIILQTRVFSSIVLGSKPL